MPTFVAVYRGKTVAGARLIAVTAEPALVSDVVAQLLRDVPDEDDDPVVRALDAGKRHALHLIRREPADAPA